MAFGSTTAASRTLRKRSSLTRTLSWRRGSSAWSLAMLRASRGGSVSVCTGPTALTECPRVSTAPNFSQAARATSCAPQGTPCRRRTSPTWLGTGTWALRAPQPAMCRTQPTVALRAWCLRSGPWSTGVGITPPWHGWMRTWAGPCASWTSSGSGTARSWYFTPTTATISASSTSGPRKPMRRSPFACLFSCGCPGRSRRSGGARRCARSWWTCTVRLRSSPASLPCSPACRASPSLPSSTAMQHLQHSVAGRPSRRSPAAGATGASSATPRSAA
mmetsp:Transcript_43142/g.109709  ORF Transcript_43142/g.109709 Transcript_43142/m.109709 type:complete len:275 (-) Transcript_43142:81-905(-)